MDEAPTKTVPVKTWLDRTERDELQRQARAEGRSIAGQVAYLIRQYLDGKGRK